MIKLNELSKIYEQKKQKTVKAVDEVSLDIISKEFVVITGRSGSGKTTLLNLIAGLAEPTKGQVFIDGVDLWELSDADRSALRNQKMGFVFQFPSLLQSLNTVENVVLPTIFSQKKTTQADIDRAMRLLEIVGLTDKAAAYPRQLSAGQQQRVVIARALINEPELLLADEPTSNLDEQTAKEIMDIFHDIHRNKGITILLVTHTGEITTSGTRSIFMANGSIASDISNNSHN
ncbi:MAG: ABC transporter ATP-binding protein [Anaerolineaceae bacterium]|jgi:ABC-type lipoprotein export system ATPase subunit|nr:ABC transporter ATP-binding protein [Anaerolineaceae bacterium]